MVHRAFLAATIAFALLLHPVPTVAQPQADTTARDSVAYTPAYETEYGTELVAVYLGAEWCSPCKRPNVKEAVRRMKPLLEQQANERGWSFSAMGVSLDWKVDTGYNFLQSNGAWDEVVVGKNWTNLGASRFIWADSTAKPSIPQVVLLKREVNQGARLEMSDYQALRRIGGGELQQWVEQGAPLSKEE